MEYGTYGTPVVAAAAANINVRRIVFSREETFVISFMA